MRRVALALVPVALALTGCETTAEKSARLERTALAKRAAAGQGAAHQEISVKGPSRFVKVARSGIVRGGEGTVAAALVLRNDSADAQAALPIAIEALSSSGAVVYSNAESGLAHSLVQASLIAAHGELVWVDDQVQAAGTPARLTAEVGEGTRATGALPAVALGAHRESQEAGSTVVSGSVTNRSAVPQRELVVACIATKGGQILAAGRAVLASVAAGQTASFQIFMVGPAAGAQLRLSVAPSTLG